MKTLSSEFKTSLQTTLKSAEHLADFTALLKVLQECGFYGIELNLPQLDAITPESLRKLLESYGLRFHMLATGAYAKMRGLSLSDSNAQKRLASVEGAKENIDYAAQMGAGIILGFFKGPKDGAPNARELLIESLRELGPYAMQKGTPILLEATNKRETNVVNTMEDALSIIKEVGCLNIKPLLDTYHLDIEEPTVADTLRTYANDVVYLHISDNTRNFPGLGSLDFAQIYNCLRQIKFKGFLTIEGNLQTSEIDDVLKSVEYLSKL